MSHWGWGILMRHGRSTAVSSGSNCAAGVTPWPSSTWAISYRPSEGRPGSLQTMVAISVSLWTTRRRPAKHSRRLALRYLMVRSLIFGTLEATGEIVGYDNIQFTKAPNVLRG